MKIIWHGQCVIRNTIPQIAARLVMTSEVRPQINDIPWTGSLGVEKGILRERQTGAEIRIWSVNGKQNTVKRVEKTNLRPHLRLERWTVCCRFIFQCIGPWMIGRVHRRYIVGLYWHLKMPHWELILILGHIAEKGIFTPPIPKVCTIAARESKIWIVLLCWTY